jgi:hypothetical protein
MNSAITRQEQFMAAANKQQVVELLKSIETGDSWRPKNWKVQA